MRSRSRPRLTRDTERSRAARPPTPTPDEKLMTITEVATALAVSTRTVRRWIESGQLHAYRFDRAVRIAPSDLNDFLGRRRVP